jgi:hypothetical protein
VNLVREEERRGPKTWPKGTNHDSTLLKKYYDALSDISRISQRLKFLKNISAQVVRKGR